MHIKAYYLSLEYMDPRSISGTEGDVVVSEYFDFTRLRGLASRDCLSPVTLEKIGQIAQSLEEKFQKLKKKKKRGETTTTTPLLPNDQETKLTVPPVPTAAWKKRAVEINRNQALKTVKIIVNSLTESNVENVESRLLKSMVRAADEGIVEGVLECILSSSLMQPLYVHHYVLLCRSLARHLSTEKIQERLMEKLTQEQIPLLHTNKLSKIQYRCLSLFYSSCFLLDFAEDESYLSFLKGNIEYFHSSNAVLKELAMDAMIHSFAHLIKWGTEAKIGKTMEIVRALQAIWEDPKTTMVLRFKLYDIRDHFASKL